MNRNTFFYAIGASVALVCTLWLVNVVDLNIVSLAFMKNILALASAYKDEHYALVVCSYLGLFVLLTACFIPITVIMTVLGGYLFGGFYGGLYATIGATLGGGAVFLLVRYLLRDRVHRNYTHQFRRFNRTFKHSASYLLCLQVSPVTPTFLINLFVGLTDVRFSTYIWTGFVGMMPGSLIYAYAGEKLHHIKKLNAVMPPYLFFILLGVSCLGIVFLFIGRLNNKEI